MGNRTPYSPNPGYGMEKYKPAGVCLVIQTHSFSSTADCYLISSKGDVGLTPKQTLQGKEETCILWQYCFLLDSAAVPPSGMKNLKLK